jgi:hypothetical protein
MGKPTIAEIVRFAAFLARKSQKGKSSPRNFKTTCSKQVQGERECARRRRQIIGGKHFGVPIWEERNKQ